MDQKLFASLCKAGRFKDALGLAVEGHELEKFVPSRFSLDKRSGLPIFYRGNKRVEGGRHVARDRLNARFKATMRALAEDM